MGAEQQDMIPKGTTPPARSGSGAQAFADILEQLGPQTPASSGGGYPGGQILGPRSQGWMIGQSLVGRPGYTHDDANMPVGRPPEDIARLQQALIDAGLLNQNRMVAAGAWNAAEQTAFRKLLTFANLNNMTWQEALGVYSQMAAQGRATGQGYGSTGSSSGGGDNVPVFQAQVSNPDDIRLALKDASGSLRAGGAFDDATLGRLVEAYQAQEIADQRAAFDAQLTGQTVTQPRSAETMARNLIRQQDPAGVGAREYADRYQEFLAALNPGVGPQKL